MTIRTKNLKISKIVVLPIPIHMMDTQNFGKVIIRTFFTPFEHISSNHHFSNCCELWFESLFLRFIHTRLRAIFSYSRRAINKILTTMKTLMFNNTIFSKIVCVTFMRTKFRFINTIIFELIDFITKITIPKHKGHYAT